MLAQHRRDRVEGVIKDCAPDANTLCFARDTVRASVRLINSDGVLVPAPAVQTSRSTGYFSTSGTSQPDVAIKIYDFAVGGGARWIVLGGLTNQNLQIAVEDLEHHDAPTYTIVTGHYLEPIVDAFLNL